MLICVALLLGSLSLARGAPKLAFRATWNDADSVGTAGGAGSKSALHIAGAAIGSTFAMLAAAQAAMRSKRKHGFYNGGPSASNATGRSVYTPAAWSDSESVASDENFDQTRDDSSVDEEQSDNSAGVYESDLEETFEEAMDASSGQAGAGKLWTSAQFPEGSKGHANWDLQNIAAVQDWKCPCPDQNCLDRERYPRVDPLYDFRKGFQTKSKGLRDTFRQKFLEPAFSATTGAFSRSCRVGDRNDICIAAAGLAAGLSFATFANARADVTKGRPFHKGRCKKRDELESKERIHINAYIRDLRSTMEGSKGSLQTKWFTGKRSGLFKFSSPSIACPVH